MRLLILMFAALLLVSACNLSNQATTPTTDVTTIQTQEVVATQAASVTPLPGIAATLDSTRTPFANNVVPTTQATALPDSFPTLASGERAEITFPASEGTVFAPTVYVSGVAHNLPQDQFTLQIFDGTGQPLTNGQTIPLSNPNHVADVPWSASVMVRSYTGAAQIRILAQTSSGTESVVGSVNVNIVPGTPNSIVQPASGSSVATITSPANGGNASGDPITVTGTAGGIADNQFTLLLLDGSGTVINSQVITLTGAEQNAVPWSAALGTSGYHGSAEIRAVLISNGQQTTITSVKVNLQ